VCFQLKDESIYYGEISYLDEKNQVHDPKQEADAATKGKPVRHGFGIQIFGASNDDFLCKYEGFWERDKMHGECRCYYPDKATYEGNMKSDVKEGFGVFTWPNGD
jgi:hypothetical protein